MRQSAFTLLLLVAGILPAAGASRQVLVGDIKGTINPPMAGYVQRVLDVAAERSVQAVVLRIDTPGGLMDSMKEITQAMLNSPVPVITYVAPRGAWAASAGVPITMAGNVAAMAPGSNIGAAHPVGPPEKSTMDKKVTNHMVSMAQAIANERGRNAAWAERAVRESVSVTNRQAVKLRVVDFTADSMASLLRQADGRKVKVGTGKTVVLRTRGAEQVALPPNIRERFLGILADPNVAYVLFTIGILAIIAELNSPGAILPGVTGGICLVLGLYSLSALSINYAGLALLLFGIGLLIADLFATSHGVLTVGGIISFAIGSLMLTGLRGPGMSIGIPVIAVTTALLAGFFLFIASLGIRAQFRKVTTGSQGLIGAPGVVRTRLDPGGMVLVQGELWKAVSAAGPLEPGTRIRVTALNGFELTVAPETEEHSQATEGATG